MKRAQLEHLIRAAGDRAVVQAGLADRNTLRECLAQMPIDATDRERIARCVDEDFNH